MRVFSRAEPEAKPPSGPPTHHIPAHPEQVEITAQELFRLGRLSHRLDRDADGKLWLVVEHDLTEANVEALSRRVASIAKAEGL